MPDLSVYEKLKGFSDYQKANEEFQLKKQLMEAQAARNLSVGAGGGQKLPAALQLANEYQDALDAGDVERAGYIAQFAKIYDKGLSPDTQGGIGALQGYADSVGSIEATKAGYKQQAEKNVDLTMNPQIKEREAYAGEVGKQQGETAMDLNATQAAMPQLEEATKRLSELGKKATYSYAGQAKDFASKQALNKTTEGATARAAYVAHVKNNVLPLLRRTFGAAFTKAEGDSLLATLGDPNMSPEEKDAVLGAFITDKKATIGTMQRQTGQSEADATVNEIFNPEGSTPSAPVELKRQPPSMKDAVNELRRRGKL